MDQFIKVAGTEGKVGGYFCRLPPLNENTVFQGIHLKNIQATLLDLVHDMWSQCALQMYEVSSKYLNGYQVVEQTRFCDRPRDV